MSAEDRDLNDNALVIAKLKKALAERPGDRTLAINLRAVEKHRRVLIRRMTQRDLNGRVH